MSSVCDDFSIRETSREQPPVPMTPISPSFLFEARRIDPSSRSETNCSFVVLSFHETVTHLVFFFFMRLCYPCRKHAPTPTNYDDTQHHAFSPRKTKLGSCARPRLIRQPRQGAQTVARAAVEQKNDSPQKRRCVEAAARIVERGKKKDFSSSHLHGDEILGVPAEGRCLRSHENLPLGQANHHR